MTQPVKIRQGYNPENVFYISVAAVIVTKMVCNTVLRIALKK